MGEFKDDEQLTEQQKAEKEAKRIYEANRELVLVLVKEGKLPDPRKLSYSERRKLDASGLHMWKIKPDDKRGFLEVKEDMVDWILATVYPNFDFDGLDNNICVFFGEYVFGLSYRNDLSVKN